MCDIPLNSFLGKKSAANMTPEERGLIRSHLASYFRKRGVRSAALSKVLRLLPLADPVETQLLPRWDARLTIVEPSPFPFVRPESAEEDDLFCRILQYPRISWAKYYTDHVIPHLPNRPDVLDEVVDEMFGALETEGSLDSSVRALLSDLKFVATQSGARERPASLVDPSATAFARLFEDQPSLVPEGRFLQAPWPGRLSLLGLRKGFASRQAAIDLLKTVASAGETKSKNCLRYINNHLAEIEELNVPGDISVAPFRAALASVKWLHNRVGVIVSAGESRPEEDAALVGQLLPVVAPDPPISKTLRTIFGWDRLPPLDVIIQHVVHLATHEDRTVNTALMQKLYRVLDDHVTAGGTAVDAIKRGFHIDVDCSRQIPWIAVQPSTRSGPSRFLTTDEVTVYGPSLHPFVYLLHETVASEFESLLVALGVRPRVTPSEICEMLARIGTEPLPADRLKFAVAAVIALSEMSTGNSDRDPIFVPTSLRTMVSLSGSARVFYEDSPGRAGNGKILLLHPDVPLKVAQKLKIPFASSALFQTFCGFGKSFAQKSAFTDRLKHILADYAADDAILRELFANADDAGARTFE
ncbi:hypothetical protein BDK51DRAFT_26595, partial [Blyttiomyces helicus]